VIVRRDAPPGVPAAMIAIAVALESQPDELALADAGVPCILVHEPDEPGAGRRRRSESFRRRGPPCAACSRTSDRCAERIAMSEIDDVRRLLARANLRLTELRRWLAHDHRDDAWWGARGITARRAQKDRAQLRRLANLLPPP
jgi:hypothetical protein